MGRYHWDLEARQQDVNYAWNGMVNWCEVLGLICTAVVWLLERKQMGVITP